MLELEKFLPYRLSVLSNRVSQGIAQTYQERFGLSVTEWRVIALIGRFPGLSASEVAQRAAMDKVAISRAVRNLLDEGRIEREASTDDRRTRHLSLSPTGQAIYREIVPAAMEYEQRLISSLNQQEQHLLEQLIDRLHTKAGQMVDAGTVG